MVPATPRVPSSIVPVLLPIVAFCGLAVAGPAPAEAWTWLPSGTTVPVPTADPREPGVGFAYVEDDFLSARLGTSIPIGRARDDGGLETGLDGQGWLWFKVLPRWNFPLETFDGTFGIWAGARGERLSWRVRLSHWSGHLADGTFEVEARRIVYSRESLMGLAFWDVSPHLQLYGGPGLFVRAEPVTQAFLFQAGGELRPDRAPPTGADPRGPHIDPFLAVDLRAKAENDMRVNQTYRAGVRLEGAPGGHAVRIALGYDSGVSERGQFWQTPESYVSLGLTFGP